MGRFDGCVAIVTGATRGIGQACAIRMASDGAVVAVNHRPDGDPSTTLAAIERLGGRAFPVAADMKDTAAIRSMIATVVREAGRLDYLINNAGICPFVPWDEITDELWDEVVDTNLRAYFVATQASARVMVDQGEGGAVVSIGSISGMVGGELQVAYTPTKAGISSLMKSFAIALGTHGIRCNTLLPGTTLTDMNRSQYSEGSELRVYMEKRTPLHRLGDPMDIADVAAFMCSDDARFMTGSDVVVDGGAIVSLQ